MPISSRGECKTLRGVGGLENSTLVRNVFQELPPDVYLLPFAADFLHTSYLGELNALGRRSWY